MLDARGVMEPWQEPRSGRGWFVLLLGILVFAAFGGVVGYAYFKGLPGIGGEPPLIRAEPGPYRVAPQDRGGLAISNANSRIVAVLGGQPEETRVERVLPPEAAPALEASEPEPMVRAPEDGSGGLGRLATPETPGAGDATATATDALGLPYPRSKPLPLEPGAEAVPADPSLQISALPSAEPPATAADAPASAEPQPTAQAPAAPARAAPTPQPELSTAPTASPPTPSPAPPAPAPTAPTAPRQLVRVEPSASPASVATPRPASSGGIYRLQLAAVRAEGGLTQAWADLRQRYPAALGDVTPQVERTDTTSGPLFRLQAGPFSTRDAASSACSAIRASGGQCFIVGPIGQ
ncbi:MAG: SPOR domain-containing protein [Geminicoccaceae bacterium]